MFDRTRAGLEDRIAAKTANKIFQQFSKCKQVNPPKPKEKSMIKQIVENPDKFELTARVVDNEFVLKIRRIEDV